MTQPRFIVGSLVFTSQTEPPASVDLNDGLNLIYGASNTGKTFFLKSLDFMLGGGSDLPEIDERAPFDKITLNLDVSPIEKLVLQRAMVGGAFSLPAPEGEKPRKLSPKHNSDNDNNLSNYLLGLLNLKGKRIAEDANGQQRGLSFRDLVRYSIVDETTIQSETSPFESGQYQFRTVERSVLKLLLTGQDDSAIVPVMDRKTFRTSKAARLSVIDEILHRVNSELEADYPDIDDIVGQNERLEKSFGEMQVQLRDAEATVTELLKSKRTLATDISSKADRLSEVRLNLARFTQLGAIYKSDVERLASLEEAAFLLTLTADHSCPLCGAAPDAQKHKHAVEEVGDTKAAALAEIAKIKALDTDLAHTIKALEGEEITIEKELPELREQLAKAEADISAAAPETAAIRQKVSEIFEVRDKVKHGLELLKQKHDYEVMRQEVEAEKEAKPSEKPKLGVAGTVAHEYGQVVSKVLKRWHFPGECHVAFDDDTYDLRIDGKLRSANGKGVRAITHAAMKVAMLLYCRERKLPHPGFLLLDTPLLTYRDPLTSRAGELSDDEAALSKTSLKDYFFEHLLELNGVAQSIILENVDPPTGVAGKANTIVFQGRHGTGRYGLFPKKSA